MHYHLDLFTTETWSEFLAHGATMTGFRESRWSRVKKIEVGDLLLCYVIKEMRWVGVLEVTGEPVLTSEPRIWQSDEFPSRLPVRIAHHVDVSEGIPAKALIDEMPMFRALKDPQREWGGFFLGSPQVWPEEDAAIVVDAIRSGRRALVATSENDGPSHETIESSDEVGTVTVPEDSDTTEGDASQHTRIQALLAILGDAMGFNVYIARNDRRRRWQGKALGDFDGVVDQLPLSFDRATLTVIELIDVLWLEGSAIAAAFEIESTTSVYSGLLRMSDLLALQPNIAMPIFIVAPESRRGKVLREVNRPTFRSGTHPLDKIVRLMSFEALELAFELHVLSHLNISYVIEELSESCELAVP